MCQAAAARGSLGVRMLPSVRKAVMTALELKGFFQMESGSGRFCPARAHIIGHGGAPCARQPGPAAARFDIALLVEPNIPAAPPRHL